jgi:hypothetical protein
MELASDGFLEGGAPLLIIRSHQFLTGLPLGELFKGSTTLGTGVLVAGLCEIRRGAGCISFSSFGVVKLFAVCRLSDESTGVNCVAGIETPIKTSDMLSDVFVFSSEERELVFDFRLAGDEEYFGFLLFWDNLFSTSSREKLESGGEDRLLGLSLVLEVTKDWKAAERFVTQAFDCCGPTRTGASALCREQSVRTDSFGRKSFLSSILGDCSSVIVKI